MCYYTRLTPFEREKILFFLAEGKSITEIAHLLKRSKSTISRELRRNAAPVDQPMPYCPLTAQALYKQRREACHPHKRLEHAPLHSYIQICILEYHWSPEEIVGRIQLEHGCRLVSVPTLYRAIHAGLLNRQELQRSSYFGNYGITGNGVTRKATKNIVASSSYRTPSKSVLPVQRTVPSVATGKRILWWASKERHASSQRNSRNMLRSKRS